MAGYYIYIGNNSNITKKTGYTFPIYNYIIGTYIHLILLNKELYSKYIRASGTYARISKKLNNYYIIKLRSKYYFKISMYSIATYGVLNNKKINFNNSKAGVTRFYGIKPHVRGVAMNPIDHPHGGGQGKTSGGRPSSSR